MLCSYFAGSTALLHAHTCCSLCAKRSVNISSCGRSACSLSLSTTTFVCSMDSSRAATSASLRLTSTCISLKRSIERCTIATHRRRGQRASKQEQRARQQSKRQPHSEQGSKQAAAKHIHTCKSYCSLRSLSSLPLTSSSLLCSSSLLASASNLCVVGWAGDRGGCEGG